MPRAPGRSAAHDCARALALGAAVLAAAGSALARDADPTGFDAIAVDVSLPLVDTALAPLAPGLQYWLLRALGVPADEAAQRTAEPPSRAESPSRADTRLAARLVRTPAGLEIALAVRRADSLAPTRVARRAASAAELGASVRAALAEIAPTLGADPQRLPPPPSIEELAVVARASEKLAARDAGGAYQEVEGSLSPRAIELRDSIEARARAGDFTPVERARIFGRLRENALAWRELEAPLAARKPDPGALVAAAELALADQNPVRAEAFANAAIAAADETPQSARAHIVLGQIQAKRGARDAARSRFERAAALATADPAPLLLAAEQLPVADPRRAPLLADAASRAADRFDAYRSGIWLDQATRLEPTLGGRSARVRATLASALGDETRARAQLEAELASGSRDPELLVQLARSQRALGDDGAAETSLREALSLESRHAAARLALADLYSASRRGADALALLAPLDAAARATPAARFSEARALDATGDSPAALEILSAAAAAPNASEETLRELARAQQRAGDLAAAESSLARAAELDPFSREIQTALSELRTLRGDSAGAAEAAALASLLGGSGDPGTPEPPVSEDAPAAAPILSYAALVESFAARLPRSREQAIVLLPLQRDPGSREWAWRATHLREPDRNAIETGFASELARHFASRAVDWRARPAELALAQKLFEFENPRSLDSAKIAEINQQLGTDAVFVARLRASGPTAIDRLQPASGCSSDDSVVLEVRMLSGTTPAFARAHANRACLDAGDVPTRWNLVATAGHALLLGYLALRLLRGFGGVDVELIRPAKTRGYFSIRVANKAGHLPIERARRESLGRKLYAVLRRIARWEQHLVVRRASFRFIPVRRRPYTVTLRGPLFDATSDSIIGHFLEQRSVLVERGRVTRVEFDLKPREACIELSVVRASKPVNDARVALRGQPGGIRYARDARCYLYVQPGDYRVLVGAGDRVAEHLVEVRSTANAIPLLVDLGDRTRLVFQDCAAAITPYLEGDFAAAADALEAAGQTQAGNRIRAEQLLSVGRGAEAVDLLRKAGEVERAAEVAARHQSPAAAAALYEESGEFARAAEAHRAAGDAEAAARCYEAAFQFDEALACYRELERTDKCIELCEKLGRYLEAARGARALGDAARALRNLQQLARRDADFGEGCILAAEILSERGDAELAVEKLEQAFALTPNLEPALELQRSYAELCDRAGRHEKAIAAYQELRRRAPDDVEAMTRLTALRELSSAALVVGASRRSASASRYEILGELGRGGMGVVYKARDRELGRVVALKCLPETLREHPTAVALFRREAQAAARLNHPNIVTLFDAGEEDGNYFLTMELLEGWTLRQILERRGHLSARDVAKLGGQICAGLEYAARQRIVHRDIKLGNLFLTRDRVVKIMDFGLAKTIEAVRKHSTCIGGTPTHMAPEQARGLAVDARTDLYALGVCLFELLTGELPYRDGDLAWHHANAPVPDPRSLVPEVPAALAELVVALLAKQPDERPASAAAVAARLAGI